MSSLAFIDYILIGAYLVAVIAIGIRAARKQKTTSDYFVANRRIPAYAVGFTMMATTISSATFVAIPGSVYARDWWQLFYMSAALIGALNYDMGFNFEMTPMLIGLFSNGVLFVVGYVVSVLFGGMRPDITGLTRQSASGSAG